MGHRRSCCRRSLVCCRCPVVIRTHQDHHHPVANGKFVLRIITKSSHCVHLPFTPQTTHPPHDTVATHGAPKAEAAVAALSCVQAAQAGLQGIYPTHHHHRLPPNPVFLVSLATFLPPFQLSPHSRPSSGRFLQKGQGTLASDRTGSGRGLSPARPQGGYAVPGRVSPSGRSGAGRFPSPRVRAPQGESRDVDAIQASFDHVRSLVVKLVDLQQQLQREQNASPSRQRRLSERMFRVREELLRLQPPG